jgi:ssDNA-binding Zn-finger/Zn-ribbon topoisomerase 1
MIDIFKCEKCGGQKMRTRGQGMYCWVCDRKPDEKTDWYIIATGLVFIAIWLVAICILVIDAIK